MGDYFATGFCLARAWAIICLVFSLIGSYLIFAGSISGLSTEVFKCWSTSTLIRFSWTDAVLSIAIEVSKIKVRNYFEFFFHLPLIPRFLFVSLASYCSITSLTSGRVFFVLIRFPTTLGVFFVLSAVFGSGSFVTRFFFKFSRLLGRWILVSDWSKRGAARLVVAKTDEIWGYLVWTVYWFIWV